MEFFPLKLKEKFKKIVFWTIMNLRVGPLVHNTIQLCLKYVIVIGPSLWNSFLPTSPIHSALHALLSDRFPHFTFHTTVRDLGVTLDSALTFSQHISNLTRSSYFQLRRLRTIRKAVSVPIFTSIVHAFVCSRIDYCNSLLIGLPKTRL